MNARNTRNRILRYLLLFSAILLFLPTFSVAGQKTVPDYKEGEVLVKFKQGFGLAAVKSADYGKGTSVVKDFPFLSEKKGQPYLHLRSDRLSTEELLAQFKDDPRVESVSPNYIRRLAKFPLDPRFNELWGLNNFGQRVNGVSVTAGAYISAPLAWDTSTGSDTMMVAVIDTGVDFSHEDLFANIWVNPGEIHGNGTEDDDHNGYVDDFYGINAITGTGNPSDDHGHGTHVSGIIAGVGNNGLGITGVNWHAKIMGVKIFDSNNSGTTADVIITAIEYVTKMKGEPYNIPVVAINASWGGGGFSQAEADAIEAAGEAGIVFVAAAGNYGLNNDAAPFYPASYNLPNIISVAATDQNDNLAGFSNYGLTSVDLAAPGVNILSTLPGFVGTVPGTEPFFDNMESDTAKWVHGGFPFPDTWALTDSRFHSESHSWTDSPAGDYLINTSSYLKVANDIDLRDYASPDSDLRLRFWASVTLEKDEDFLKVEISNDSGDSFPYQLAAISEQNAAWTLYSYQIPVDYRVKEFRFRFLLESDEINNSGGVYIDDVGIASNFGKSSSNLYGFMDGTSMAAPYVTGAIALVSAKHSTDTITQKINRVLSGVDRKAGLEETSPTPVATAGRLNLNNTLNNTWKIEGTIIKDDDGSLLPKVLVKLVDLSLGDTVLTDTVMSDTTNASGQYSLFGQNMRQYRIVPELAGYKFEPVYREIDSLTADTEGLDFSAKKKVYDIFGTVTTVGPETHDGLIGVEMTLSDTSLATKKTLTGTSGSFILDYVLPGRYNVTPSKTGWVFEPASCELTVVDTDVTAEINPELDFTARLEITLTRAYGTPPDVPEGGTVTCAVEGTIGDTDISNSPYSINYSWHALGGGLFQNTGSDTSDWQNPVWVAPDIYPLGSYSVYIEVTVSCEDGEDGRKIGFGETVNQKNDLPPGGSGGALAVGPLAVGISALLGWWKRRKRRQ